MPDAVQTLNAPAVPLTYARRSGEDHGRGFGGGGDGDGDAGGERRKRNHRAALTAIWFTLAPVSMFFMAFASAYVVRESLGGDWQPLDLPPLMWLNTAILLGSSAALELARRRLKDANDGQGAQALRRWLVAATLLGVGFLAGQTVAWMGLASQGVYLSSNPSHSFFYVITVAHALHLLIGVVALGYVTWLGAHGRLGPARRTAVDVTAVYWHFMDGLWIFLFMLLSVWR